MKNIIENDIKRMDLNLLLVLHVLLEEGNVTRTAERLYLGQPAISGALSRLRESFGDPLFIRTPKGMRPTARAVELGERFRPFLQELHRELQGPPSFDPATSERLFHVGMSDALEVTLMPALLRCLSREAPGVRVIAHQTDTQRGPAMLEAKEIELAVGVFDQAPSWQRREPLLDWHFVCLHDPARIALPAEGLTLPSYLAHPHLLTSFSASLTGFIDERLAELGEKRRVIFSSRNFSTLAFMLKEMPAFTTMPSYIARIWRDGLGLEINELPFPVPEFSVSLLWSAADDLDPGLVWLRDRLRSLG